jgi:hypothetical protein
VSAFFIFETDARHEPIFTNAAIGANGGFGVAVASLTSSYPYQHGLNL